MIYDLQKASMWKRISAFLFDGILLGIVAVLFAWVLSLALGYDRYSQSLNAAYEHYGEVYEVNMRPGVAEYEALDEDALARLDAAYEELGHDPAAVKAYNMVIQLTLLITSIGIFLAYLGMEFVVPLLFGNGQTLGKKIFSLGVMNAEGIKLTPVALFIRTVLGKYTIETMIPVLILLMLYWGSIGIVGPIVLFLILVVQLAVLIGTRTNSLIHDLLATTVVVDLPSQMIFDTREDMIAYKERVHAEQVAREPY
ncbi:MAG: RDD family protein [Clostridia bacterium]|nr:RDD family protein [Clostridia bacterium]